METLKKTTDGVLFWTPAPVHISSTTSEISEEMWEDEDEDQSKREDDFVSQMDDNGIIGLTEALEDTRLKETHGTDVDCNPALCNGLLTPEEADPGRNEMARAPERLSYTLSEHQSLSETPGEVVQVLSPLGDDMCIFKEQKEHEQMMRKKKEQRKHKVDEDKRINRNQGMHGHMNGSGEGYSIEGENEKIASTQSFSAQLPEPAEVSNNHYPKYQSSSTLSVPTVNNLFQLSSEEMSASTGIDSENVPEINLSGSLTELHSGLVSPRSSPQCQLKSEMWELNGLQPAAIPPELVMTNHYSSVPKGPSKSNKYHKQPDQSQRKRRQHASEATLLSTLRTNYSRSSPDRTMTNTTKANESRKESVRNRMPNFSKVEPRVCFPKCGYKPPKSKNSPKWESMSPEPPLVFKSPADIVKEVLLSATDGLPAEPLPCDRPPTNVPNSTVPLEFRSRQQATRLLEQLEEDYKRLLTRYAEAENTIDRLRLEAKVNMCSDPPKPNHCVQSGLSSDDSKVMMLDLPQAQRAQLSSDSCHPDGHSTYQRGSSSASITSSESPEPQVGQQLTKILYNQADMFLQQLQTFEDLLKSKKLKAFEQAKGLSQLVQGLDSLEKGYLLARDEQVLGHFDSERHLEKLIFQCGLHMDELKEQVEQIQMQEQHSCEGSPSPPPQLYPSPVSSDAQSQPESMLVDRGGAAMVEMSPATEESDDGKMAELNNSVYFKPVNEKQSNQSFQELQIRQECGLRDEAYLSAALGTDMEHGHKNTEGQDFGNGKITSQKSLPERQAESDLQDSVPSSKQWNSKSKIPSCTDSTTDTVHLPVGRMKLVHSSSLNSLGEITASEGRSYRMQTKHRRVLSQDRIISPESGYLGSESSRLTLAAAASPNQGRAPNSVSEPQTSPASVPLPLHRRIEPIGGSQFNHSKVSRARQMESGCSFSCSLPHLVSQTEQTRADKKLGKFGTASDNTHPVSEEQQSDQYPESINSLHFSCQSSSPVARCHRVYSVMALSSSQVANCNDAVQTLQTEVTRVKDKLEISMRNKKLLNSVKAASSSQDNHTHHDTSTPCNRLEEHWCSTRRGEKERWMFDNAKEQSEKGNIFRRRSFSVQTQKPQPDILITSELEDFTSRCQVSRCTQTSAEASDSPYSGPSSVCSRRTQTIGDDMCILKGQTEHEQLMQNEEQRIDIMEEGMKGCINQRKNEHTNVSTEHYSKEGENEKISSIQSYSAQLPVAEFAGGSNHHFSKYQSSSPLSFPIFHNLFHFTAEEMSASTGIDSETFPEMNFSESLAELHSSLMSPRSSPQRQLKSEIGEPSGLQPTAILPESVMANYYTSVSKALSESSKYHKQPTQPQRKKRQHGPEAAPLSTLGASCSISSSDRAMINATEADECRKDSGKNRMPDFSKVEPRVSFPEGGYKPPKSRHATKWETQSHEPPFLFKSPSDIVKEVLLNATDGPPDLSACDRPPASPPNTTGPWECRCHQPASTVLKQLQSQPEPLMVDSGGAPVVDLRIPNEESYDRKMDDELSRNSVYFQPLNETHRQAETDHLDSPVPSSKQQTSRSGIPSCIDSTTLPFHPLEGSGMKLSHSSSLNSLGELTASERRSYRLQTEHRRVLFQDKIIHPETDISYVCSESSRLTLAATASPINQRVPDSVSEPQEENSGKPQGSPPSAPSLSHRRMTVEPRGVSQFRHGEASRTRQVENDCRLYCSPPHFVSETDQTGADSETIKVGTGRDNTHTGEGRQNDQYRESIIPLHSSCLSSSPIAQYHRVDSLMALSSSQVTNRNDAVQTLQTEVNRVNDKLEISLRNKKPLLNSMNATSSSQDNHTHHNTSSPLNRSGESWHDTSERERWMFDQNGEKSETGSTARDGSFSASGQKPQPDISITPEPKDYTSRLQVSRCTQTSAAESESPSNVCNRTTQTRQNPIVSAVDSEGGSRATSCPQSLLHHRGQSQNPAGGSREPAHIFSSRCCHCPLCGCTDPYRSTEPECCRDSHSPKRTSSQPAKSVDTALRNRHSAAAAPTTLLQCVQACPPPLLLCPHSQHVYVSPSKNTGTSFGVRGHTEMRGKTQPSVSADKQRSVESSLNRAIRAARHMKHTSRHMARSLATGLQHQELLSQS